MMTLQRTILKRYGFATLVVFAALGVTFFVPWLADRDAFTLLIGAVALSSWYGGRGAGRYSCFIAAGLQNYLIFEPHFEFSFEVDAIVPMLLFLVVALMITSLTTYLVEALERAREQGQWLQVTLSSIGDAVVSLNGAGDVTFMNRVAERLTGCELQHVKGQPIQAVIPIKDGNDSDPIRKAYASQDTVQITQGSMLTRKNGALVPIEGNASPIKDRGELRGAVFVFRDVTEREEARSKILEYQQRQRISASEVSLAEERARRAIATGLHDRVGQSLALTRIKLFTLRTKLSDPDLVQQFDEINQFLKQIVTETRSLTFELSPPILYELGLVPALEWLAGSMFKQQTMTCEFSSSGDVRPLKDEFAILLFQATRELLTNVLKHSNARKASVAVSRTGNNVAVEVRDDGVGFETRDDVSKPNGYGLFNIRERIQHLGGAFSVDSQVGHGACVRLELPIAN